MFTDKNIICYIEVLDLKITNASVPEIMQILIEGLCMLRSCFLIEK